MPLSAADNVAKKTSKAVSKTQQAAVKSVKEADKAAEAVSDATKPKLVELAPNYAQSARRISGSCFAAGTPVLTPDGHKSIDQLVIGDEILSRTEFDPFAPVVVSRVEKLFRLYAPLWELRLGGQLIETTAEHPLFVDGRGWTAVRDLNPGDRVLGLDEQYTPVESVHSTTRETPVFNLRVANEHTYFVGADDWGFAVWVHNTYSVTEVVADELWDVTNDATGDVVGQIRKTEEGKYQYVSAKGDPGKTYDTIEQAKSDVDKWAANNPDSFWPKASPKHINKTRHEFERSGGVREQYWKAEYANNRHTYSPQNQALIEKGRAPFGTDGKPMVLHHKLPIEYGGTNDFSNLAPMRYTDHSLVPNFGPLHTPPFAP